MAAIPKTLTDEDRLLPLSALQHWLYCPRQSALIHVEQAWAENRFTAEGRVLHEKAHEGPDETRVGVRITRGMAVRSLALGLSGQCDVVEFHPDGSILPVEYKRGKPKAHRADEVQLCAQAICLEEMLGTRIEAGCLYYGERRRRTEVPFDAPLRALVRETAAAVHEMRTNGTTPAADYEPRRCGACSLIDLCQPKALRFRKGAAAWFERQLHALGRGPWAVKPEARGQRPEARGQRAEGRGQRAEGRGQRAEGRGQRSKQASPVPENFAPSQPSQFKNQQSSIHLTLRKPPLFHDCSHAPKPQT